MRHSAGNAINQDVRQIWLSIRANGGWWTVRSIYHYWTPTFVKWEIEAAISSLLVGGYLTERDQGGYVSVAFTSECRLLPGTEQAADALHATSNPAAALEAAIRHQEGNHV